MSPAPNTLSIGIHGATGRMGLRLLQFIADDPGWKLSAALERPDHPRLGADVGTLIGGPDTGVLLASSWEPPINVMVDFSSPRPAVELARLCAERGIPLVVGTTGFEPAQKSALEAVSKKIPIFVASNFSKAVNLLMGLTSLAARVLGDQADVEIVERHHHFKKDAPSGTALSLADAVIRGSAAGPLAHGREGQLGPRPKGEIGMHALRTGDNPGEHTVVFGLMGECLELSHRALNRDGFARGALDAARFLVGKHPGGYTMRDLLPDLPS